MKKLQRSLHHIAAQNTLLRGEIRGLRKALAIKKARNKRSYPLQLDSTQGYHGGGVFWSSERVQQARDDEAARQQQAEQQQLQKAQIAEMKEQARLHKAQLAQERRAERERLQEVRRQERAAKLAEKERQKALRDAKKAIQLSQKGKREASKPHKPATKPQKRVGDAAAIVAVAGAVPTPPARSRRARPIQTPKKYYE